MSRSAVPPALLVAVIACAEPASPRRPVTVFPAGLNLFMGERAQLEAVNETSVLWRSTAPSVASVDGRGFVTGVAPGLAYVWAVRGGDSASAIVFVFRPACAGAPTIQPANATIAPGETLVVEARENCAPLPNGFRWTSANTAIATVEIRDNFPDRSTAIVTAKQPGQVAIRAHLVDDPLVDVALALTVRVP
ncbi:MAG TPA: Ig-like domain-containing protein [Gemmatimonadaceae bacterium]|nr:Ig-like domain-containing protein [Gemmatimonadaceae bacterium]